ncbi:hypothetical protein NHQ30_009046 [Ciborinia camelliae]|nr:hypothetical protein NHQ30_009046 [Ciborinia camelliae]
MITSTPFILVATGIILTLYLYKKIQERLTTHAITLQNHCLPAKKYPHKDPIFGLDLFLQLGRAHKTGHLLSTHRQLHATLGKTFQAKSWGTPVLYTCEARNIQTVLAHAFPNFGKVKVKAREEKQRGGASFMPQGIFTADGEAWHRGRALIRPTFARGEISNFESLERHVERFLLRIPGDGETVDLQPLVKNLFLDISTEFLFGESVESQSPNAPFDSREFLTAFDTAMRGLGARMMLGKLKFLRGRDLEFKAAFGKVHAYIEKHVTRVLADPKNAGETSASPSQGPKQYVLLNEMARETRDPVDLRYQLFHVFIPAHESTGVAVSDIFFHLARDAERWARLRAEVLSATRGREISFELLKSMKYLRWVFNESLRLHPTAGTLRRTCHHDTMLPAGGGPSGESPILLLKGSSVVLNIHVLHRERSYWGDDADEFRPERWENLRPTWEYLPFSGGPRICPAQQLVFTDAAYIIVRVMQRFEKMENRDPLPWMERVRMTVDNANGVKVRMVPV